MEVGKWIPQIFYDLIGRIAPGALILILGFLLLSDPSELSDRMTFLFKDPGVPLSLIFVAGLIFSYILGTLLGALGLAFENGSYWKRQDLSSIVAEVPIPNKPGSGIAYAYDVIQFYGPAVGARLAKLRAEIHLCRVLLLGFTMLGVSVAIHSASAVATLTYWIIVGGFALAVVASLFFRRHLAVRSRTLLVNMWELLRRRGENPEVFKIDA